MSGDYSLCQVNIKLFSTTGEVIGPEVEGDIVIFLTGHVVKLPSNYAYVHSPGLLSALVREASFRSGKASVERFISAQGAENKRWRAQP